MNKTSTYLVLAVAMLVGNRTVQAQPPEGPPGPPVFASDPTPPPSAEFCPPNKSIQRTSTVPFDNLCPVGNAFSTNVAPDVNNPAWYVGLGGMALKPLQLGKRTLSVQGSVSTDSGAVPAVGATELLNLQDVSPHFGGGIRGVVGFNFGPNAVEISGYYVFPQSSSATSSAQGANDVIFGQFPIPPGFGTTNNVWLQADVVTATRRWQVGNVEANYRYCLAKGLELLGGFRYFDFQDRISIFTDDDVLSNGGTPNPLAQATYTTQTRNRLAAFQLGVEAEQVLVPVVSVGFTGKAGIGPNFATFQQTLTRGDGFEGPGGSGNEVVASGILEAMPYLNFWFNDNFRLRVGYDLLLLTNIPSAQDQIHYNTTIPVTSTVNGGTQFFHGPIFELQVAF